MTEVVDYFWLAAIETLQRHGAETRIGQQRHLDPRHPALGHGHQAVDIGRAEVGPAEVGVELLDLHGRQAHVVLIDAQQLVLQLQPAEREARMVAPGKHHSGAAGQALEHGREDIEDGRLADELEVVEDDVEIAVDAVQRIGQIIADHLRRLVHLGGERVEPGDVEVLDLGANALGQIAKEAHRLVVTRLQRIVHHTAPWPPRLPVSEQRRLAGAGGSQQHGQRKLRTVVEQFQQFGTGETRGNRGGRLAIFHCSDPSGLFLLLNGKHMEADDSDSFPGSFETFHASSCGMTCGNSARARR
jgi:hypothetical protein